jgi:hypothetical protein
LSYKIDRLHGEDPRTAEAWLLDLANQRGARVIERNPGETLDGPDVSEEQLSNEDLVVAMCQPLREDQPQLLRPAAQLISRGAVAPARLVLIARRERAEPVLKALAMQALRVDPDHAIWHYIAEAFDNVPLPKEPILHWTRLAEPIPVNGVCTGNDWKLVS